MKAIPSNYPQLIPTIAVRDAASAIEFYRRAFGAKERLRLTEPGGKVGHSELEFGSSGLLMLADAYPEWNTTPEDAGGKTTVVLHLYVEDVDAVIERAVAEGAKTLIPVADQFYGDRSGRILDPFGHVWIISTHIEDVSEEEMKRRFAAMPSS